MMKRIIFAVLLLFSPVSVLAAEYSLNSGNTVVAFEMDSTWHKFSGSAPEVEGHIVVDDLENPKEVSGNVVISALKMTTNEKGRDEKMHSQAMESSKFPRIVYELTGYSDRKLHGNLTIKKVTMPVDLDLTLKQKEGSVIYTGKTVIQWRAFGVNDPSIFIATVYENVAITVTVTFVDKSRE